MFKLIKPSFLVYGRKIIHIHSSQDYYVLLKVILFTIKNKQIFDFHFPNILFCNFPSGVYVLVY